MTFAYALAMNARSLIYEHRKAMLGDRSIPLVTRRMIHLHLNKPWIPNYWTVLIRPTGKGGGSYLDQKLGDWYLPSRKWWLAHARASHPPDGSGCDVDVHIQYLTEEGSVHEFDYAALLVTGDVLILEPEDFRLECECWARHFIATADVSAAYDELTRHR